MVLGDTEDRWSELFAAAGKTYQPPKLRLFAGSEPTPCAFATGRIYWKVLPAGRAMNSVQSSGRPIAFSQLTRCAKSSARP